MSWYLPAGLLVVAGALTIHSWRDTASALSENWHRVLLSLVAAGLTALIVKDTRHAY